MDCGRRKFHFQFLKNVKTSKFEVEICQKMQKSTNWRLHFHHNDIQHNDIEHNDILHNDSQHNGIQDNENPRKSH